MVRTERVLIEPLSLDHLPGLFTALDDPAVDRYLGRTEVTTVQALRARIERQLAGCPPQRAPERWWNWVVRLHETGEVIGRLEATSYDVWAEIAYVFGPKWGGRGLATEATRWMVDHLFATVGMREVWAAVHPDNRPSRRLLERLGFGTVGSTDRDIGSFDAHVDVLYVRRAGSTDPVVLLVPGTAGTNGG